MINKPYQRAYITATRTRADELKPGDLFSIVGDEYWSTALDSESIGECVYIRTNIDHAVAHDGNTYVYRIVVELQDIAPA
jgi:hypothetical protein